MKHVRIGATPSINHYVCFTKDTIYHTVNAVPFTVLHTIVRNSLHHTHWIVIYVLYYVTHATLRILCIWCCTHFDIHISLYALDYTFYAISVYTHIHSKLCTPCYTIISLYIYIYRVVFSLHNLQTFLHTPCFTFLTFTANVKYDTALHCAALYYTTPHYTHTVYTC